MRLQERPFSLRHRGMRGSMSTKGRCTSDPGGGVRFSAIADVAIRHGLSGTAMR